MNAWQTLELTPNSDLQAIKQAYAIKIKQYRPDSHPEQFQQIHQAYKELTALLHRQAKTVTADPEGSTTSRSAFSHGLQFSQATASSMLDEPTNEPPHDALQPQLEAEHQGVDAELREQHEDTERRRAEAEQQAQQQLAETNRRRLEAAQARQQFMIQREQERLAFNQEMAELLQKVDENLNNINRLISLSSWQFLPKSPWLLDREFHQQLGAALLQRLVAYHKNPITSLRRSSKGRNRQVRQLVPIDVLAFLEQLFNWRGQAQWLLSGPDQKIVAELFERLEFESQAAAVDALRGNATVLLQDQPVAQRQRRFGWGGLLPWLTLIGILGHAFKYWQGL